MPAFGKGAGSLPAATSGRSVKEGVTILEESSIMEEMEIWDKMGQAAAVAFCWTLLAALAVREAVMAMKVHVLNSSRKGN